MAEDGLTQSGHLVSLFCFVSFFPPLFVNLALSSVDAVLEDSWKTCRW